MLKKYHVILLVFKDMEKGYARDQWMTGEEKYITMEDLRTWDKVDGANSDGYPISGAEFCKEF